MSEATSRRQWVRRCLFAPLAGLAACAGPAPRSAEATALALAPGGRLRACINVGNPILASRDDAGIVRGVSVDMATRLAGRLGLPLDLVVVDAARKSVETVQADLADVGFFAIDPGRGGAIGFSAPYLLIEGSYLVRQASNLTDNAQVDRAGTRIMVGRGSAYDLFLTRELKAAQLMRSPTSPEVVDRFLAENADVAAGVRQQLESDVRRLGGLRLLPGRFMVIEQAMGLPEIRSTAAKAMLAGFVEEAKASGFVAESLARHNIQGAAVAPASARPALASIDRVATLRWRNRKTRA